MKEKLNSLKNRIIDNFNKNRIPVIIMLLLWIFAVVFTLSSYSNTLGKISSGNEFFDNVVELADDLKVTESLPVVEDAESVAIKFATFARRNNGSFNVKVTGETSKKVYADKTIKVSGIQDNAFITFKLAEKLNPSVDSRITVTVSSLAEKGQGAGVYYSTQKWFEDGTLKINNKTQEGDLTIRFLNESAELSLFYNIVIIWVVTSFTLIILTLLLIKPRYEILFTLITISFGLTFWLIITPMSVPDETIHYEYSFQLSNKIMGEKDHLVFDEEYQNYGSFAGHQNISAAYERFIKKINRPLSLDNKIVKMNYDIDDSYTICFVPQALGITVARLLNWNMLRTFYLGRLFNLIFYIICVYIAIKKTPVHKVLFGILATIPIFIQQAASFSYDCYINGLTFDIIAFLLKWMNQEEKIDIKEFIFVFIVNMMIAPIKVVYGLFTFLYWFVPEKQYGSKKNKIIGTLIITAPAMYELIVLLFPLAFRIIRKAFEAVFVNRIIAENNTHSLNLTSPFKEEGEIYTFSYVTSHPVEMFKMFVRTVRYNLKVWFYGSFGRALSGNSLILPTYLVHATLAILLVSALRDETFKNTIWFRITIILLCIFAGLMMVGGMLVSWTEIEQDVVEAYGGPIIQGIQGRYFSPLLPYLFLILNNKKIRIPKKYDEYIIYSFIILVFEVIVYVLSYTFVN